MRRVLGIGCAVFMICGCGQKTSSLLLERHARGPLNESPSVARRVDWKLEPLSLTQSQKNVDVTVTFASQEFLKGFFGNKNVFGKFAGTNPYFLENMVFYVQITNKSNEPLFINPVQFVVVDDRGNQYTPINEDYVDALANAKAPMAVMTRGVLEDARPGYFGIGVPVGKLINMQPQGRFALIKQSSLQPGLIHPNVVYDGLVAFWSPSTNAKSLKLFVTDLKTDFDPEGVPKTSLEFPFGFQVQK